MKTRIKARVPILVLAGFVVVILVCLGLARAGMMEDAEDVEEVQSPPAVFLCPVSKLSDNGKCMECHQMVLDNGKPKFGLKEVMFDAIYAEKPYQLNIYEENGFVRAHYVLTSITPDMIDEIRVYLLAHPEITKLIVEIHSPGGSVMDAWRIVGLLDNIKQSGVHVETRCNGLAASAGAILLVAGDTRLVSPTAEIMIHKVWQFSMFDIADPDSAEDKADVLKHFQQNINEFIASRTNITVEELNQNTFHKMWWMTGKEAVELGVAQGFISKNR